MIISILLAKPVLGIALCVCVGFALCVGVVRDAVVGVGISVAKGIVPSEAPIVGIVVGVVVVGSKVGVSVAEFVASPNTVSPLFPILNEIDVLACSLELAMLKV